MTETILVVDDQMNVRQLLQEYLTEQGFQVLTAADGQSALYTTRRQQPDLVLLDLIMPKMDGYQFLRLFRLEHQTPVIILSAREGETDAVQGLEMGADDYVVKPFRMRELTARIRAILRRTGTSEQGKTLRGGGLVVNLDTHTVTANGQPVCLTPIEFDLLALLMRLPGQVYNRALLVEKLANSGFNGLDRTLNVHIRNLRAKIENDPSNPQYIETIFGVGYRFHKFP